MTSKHIYVGFSTTPIDKVADPHITLAFIPLNEDQGQTDSYGRPIDTGNYGDMWRTMQNFAWKLYEALEGRGFTVLTRGVDHFGEGFDVPVLRVELPPQVHELVSFFRANLYQANIRYSTLFPFDPHITISPGTIRDEETEGVAITGLFVDNGVERKTLHLK